MSICSVHCHFPIECAFVSCILVTKMIPRSLVRCSKRVTPSLSNCSTCYRHRQMALVRSFSLFTSSRSSSRYPLRHSLDVSKRNFAGFSAEPNPNDSTTTIDVESSSPLPSSASGSKLPLVVELTATNIREVLAAPVPVIIDCYAESAHPLITTLSTLDAPYKHQPHPCLIPDFSCTYSCSVPVVGVSPVVY